MWIWNDCYLVLEVEVEARGVAVKEKEGRPWLVWISNSHYRVEAM